MNDWSEHLLSAQKNLNLLLQDLNNKDFEIIINRIAEIKNSLDEVNTIVNGFKMRDVILTGEYL